MKRLLALTVALFLLAGIVCAKNPIPRDTLEPKQGKALLDSLLAELPNMKSDSEGVMLMTNIGRTYGSSSNSNEGLKWAEKALKLAQQIGWSVGEAHAYSSIGTGNMSKGNYPKALDAFLTALNLYEQQNMEVHVAWACNDVGNVYWRLKRMDRALEYHFRSLKIAQNIGDKEQVMNSYSNIGGVYQEMQKHDESLKFMKKGLQMAEEAGDRLRMIANLGNIGNLYASLNQYPLALSYNFAAFRISKEINDKGSIAIQSGNIGEVYYLIVANNHEPKPDSLVPANGRAILARSISYLKNALSLCREANFNEPIPEFAGYLSMALALQGDHKGALVAFKESTSMKDSLFNIINTETISNLETQRALELKDKDIEIQNLHLKNKRSERVFYLSGIGLLVIIVGILFNGFRRKQRSNKLLAREKKRSDDLLLNILPSEVAEELKENGEAHAQYFEETTVLYTDFVNFTHIGETLTPNVLVKELHECFSAFDAIVERHGLEKIKTVGDAYIAVCGVPVVDPRHAHKCVEAALEILKFMEARKKQERVFEIRIGINSGPVVAGIVGTKKFAYDIWGDTVNTAARMEQHGEPGRINVSQSTFELVRDEFSCNPRGRITAKHKGEVEMYFVQSSPVTA